jgi:hypothetical protein
MGSEKIYTEAFILEKAKSSQNLQINPASSTQRNSSFHQLQ